ncbi:hypothetical protein GCT19_37465 [Paraburkholderia sp. CNPSo 3155]|uniref:Phenylacetic acid catabolic protein n=1 Tax=Paraburkholderia atlantica TaxID=2654982 RepID=UPI00128C1C29|nr:Phenylacetic acid catabolic protein [Paraburkholderia atlantica]MPW11172.1 hypothetical protein [Paraburkholderia atlantica]
MRTYDFLYHHPEELPEDYKKQLWKFLSIQICIEGGMANESGIGQESSCLYTMPEARHRRFIAHKLADERNHAFGLFRLAKSIGEDPHQLLGDVRAFPEKSRALDAFKEIDYTKSHLVFEVFCFLTEAAGGIASIAALGSTYVPWALWNAKNFIDEGLTHSIVSMYNIKEAVEKGEREEAQRLYDQIYPYALDLFGGANSANEREYLRFGIKTLTNTECRVIWLRQIRERTARAGLKFPDDPYQGKRGRYDECREGLERYFDPVIDGDRDSAQVRKALADLMPAAH